MLINTSYMRQHTDGGGGTWWFTSFVFPHETMFLPRGHFHQKHHVVSPGAPKFFLQIAALKAPEVSRSCAAYLWIQIS